MRVVILGGGIVGLTAAALLAKNSDLKITLFEKRPPELTWDNNKYDMRCSAITRAAQQLFKTLDIWDEILAARVGLYDKMLVWGESRANCLEFAAASIGQPDLGHIIENRVMQRSLWNKVNACSNVTIKFSTVHSFENHNDYLRIKCNDEDMICDLLIGADGANSWLRTAAQIPIYSHAYAQKALVATIKTQHAHNYTARQCFTKGGPLAFLPLDQLNLCSIVWSNPTEKILQLMQLEPKEFCRQLQTEFAELGDLELFGDRASFPLRLQHATAYIAPRVALIGDAAHVVHPLAGQGLNLGLMDAAALAEIILNALQVKHDIGARSVLRKYERWRKGHNLSMLALTDVFNRMYELNSGKLQSLRDSTMAVVNKLQIPKNALMRFAMGLTGDLPMSAKSPIFPGLL